MNAQPTGPTTEYRADDPTDTRQPPLTVLEALRMVWKAEHYPILGNGGRSGRRETRQGGAGKSQVCRVRTERPAWMRHCVTALLKPDLNGDDRDEILSFLDNLFDPEYRW